MHLPIMPFDVERTKMELFAITGSHDYMPIDCGSGTVTCGSLVP